MRAWKLPETVTSDDGTTTVALNSAALYAGTVETCDEAGTYVVACGGGAQLLTAEDCVFPHDNPVEFGGEEVPPRVRTPHPAAKKETYHTLSKYLR